MQKQRQKGDRWDWGPLSPLVMEERAEKERAEEERHKGVTLLEKVQPGSMVATRRHQILVRDVERIPRGRLLTIKILEQTDG